MKGMCHLCYSSGVSLVLTQIEDGEIGSVLIPICDKCRDEQFVHEP